MLVIWVGGMWVGGWELGDLGWSQGVAGEVSPGPLVSTLWCKDAGAASHHQRHRWRSPLALTAGGEGTHYLWPLTPSTDVAVGPEWLHRPGEEVDFCLVQLKGLWYRSNQDRAQRSEPPRQVSA